MYGDDEWMVELRHRRRKAFEDWENERLREQDEVARRKAAEEHQHSQNQTPFPWA